MSIMRFPELFLSTNGAAALVDRTWGHIEFVAIPNLELRYTNESVQALDGLALSSAGTVAGLRTYGNRLIVINDSPPQSYALPEDRSPIVDMALSNAGDQVALLIRAGPGTSSAAGRLEIWPLPAGSAPLAAIEVPVLDAGFVTDNGALSALSVYSAHTAGTGRTAEIFVRDERGLAPLSQDYAFASHWIHAALHKEWVWVVQEEGLVGWRPGHAPVHLPGAVGDRLTFSPAGDHLMAYRVRRVVDPGSAEMLFRLYALNTLQEVAQTTHLVTDDGEKHFCLSPDLSPFTLQVTLEGALLIEDLGW
jgi:hypothetical protein